MDGALSRQGNKQIMRRRISKAISRVISRASGRLIIGGNEQNLSEGH